MKKVYVQIALSTVLLVVFDQILKEIARNYFLQPLFLTSWLALRYEENFGIAWSIAIPYGALISIHILLIPAIFLFLAKNLDLQKKKAQVVLSFILAGALGNLFDRLFRGYVIDYLAVGTFPVFNLADALLTLSVFLILVFYDKIERIPENKSPSIPKNNNS